MLLNTTVSWLDQLNTLQKKYDDTQKYNRGIHQTSIKKFKMNDWVEIVIHWQLGKKLKFILNDKWYLHWTEFVLENKTNNNHTILVGTQDLVLIFKETHKKQRNKKY